MGERGEIFSEKLFTDSDRTYFFNVKENRKGDYFLNIVESKKDANGEFERHSVFVYEENIEEFEENMIKAIAIIKEKIKEGGGLPERTEKRSFDDERDRPSDINRRFSRDRNSSGGGDRGRSGGGDRGRGSFGGGGDRGRGSFGGGGDRGRSGGSRNYR